jgi:hypothetical protein
MSLVEDDHESEIVREVALVDPPPEAAGWPGPVQRRTRLPATSRSRKGEDRQPSHRLEVVHEAGKATLVMKLPAKVLRPPRRLRGSLKVLVEATSSAPGATSRRIVEVLKLRR